MWGLTNAAAEGSASAHPGLATHSTSGLHKVAGESWLLGVIPRLPHTAWETHQSSTGFIEVTLSNRNSREG